MYKVIKDLTVLRGILAPVAAQAIEAYRDPSGLIPIRNSRAASAGELICGRVSSGTGSSVLESAIRTPPTLRYPKNTSALRVCPHYVWDPASGRDQSTARVRPRKEVSPFPVAETSRCVGQLTPRLTHLERSKVEIRRPDVGRVAFLLQVALRAFRARVQHRGNDQAADKSDTNGRSAVTAPCVFS